MARLDRRSFRAWFRPAAEIEDDVRAELRSHLELAEDDERRAGRAPDEARREARRRFGDVERVYRECRSVRLAGRVLLQRACVGLVPILLVSLVTLATWHHKSLTVARRSIEHLEAELAHRRGAPASPRVADRAAGAATPALSSIGYGAVEPPDAAARALAALRADEPWANRRAIEVGAPVVPGLVALLADSTTPANLRVTICGILGEIGSKDAVPALLDATSDPFFNVRRVAATALGRIGDARARERLAALAASDPYAWVDPATGKRLALVREDATAALARLDGIRPSPASPSTEETLMEDPTRPPPASIAAPRTKLDWPFAGGFMGQNVWNNYQTPNDVHVHSALDLIQPPGTDVRAVAGGVVRLIATNYPDWTTHHVLCIADGDGADVGWCYTHVDPTSYTAGVGDRVEPGQVIGKVVEFYVGEAKGADHLHLQYARFRAKAGGGVELESLGDPLLWFEFEDDAAPDVAAIRFVADGTIVPFASGDDGIVTVSDRVDIVTGVSDAPRSGAAGNWMVPVVALEIEGETGAPYRKLVLDQRGPIPAGTAPVSLYLSTRERKELIGPEPAFPRVHWLFATNTDGDGVIESSDRDHAWDTAATDEDGNRRFPDGRYRVTIHAFDLAGNHGRRSATVVVANQRDG